MVKTFWRHMGVTDENTCKLCARYIGNWYQSEGEPYELPFHPHCRCWWYKSINRSQFNENDLVGMKEVMDEAEQAWHDKRSEVDILELSLLNTDADYDTLKQTIADMITSQTTTRDRIDEISAEIVSTRHAIEACEEELTILIGVIALNIEDAPSPEEEARVEELEAEITRLEAEMADHKKDVGAVIQIWMDLPNEILAAENNLDLLEAKMYDLKINQIPQTKADANTLYWDWQDLVEVYAYWQVHAYDAGYDWITPVPDDPRDF